VIPEHELVQAKFYHHPDFDAEDYDFDQHESIRVNFFMHLIRWKLIQWQTDAEGFSHLKWDYLERVIQRPLLKKVIVRLIQGGVIERDHSVIRGEKCNGYRILPLYCNSKWQLLVCQDKQLNQQIQTVYSENAITPLAVHRWLTSKFDKLDFDVAQALSIIQTMPYCSDDIDPLSFRPKTLEEYHQLLEAHCQGFKDRVEVPTVCRYRRFHSARLRRVEGGFL